MSGSRLVITIMAQMVENLPAMWENWVQSPDGEDPLEKEREIYSSISPGKSHGQRSLEGYSPGGHKELDMTEQLTLLLSYTVKRS